MQELIGVGLYTSAEAGRLLGIPARKITRWLKGHAMNGKQYAALWDAQVRLEDDRVYLGFRDLMETRVAHAFIKNGVPPVRIRSAIDLAREVLAKDHPLSTNRFKTAGREIFLQVIETDEDGIERERLLNLFKRQYEFNGILDPILKEVDFGDDEYPSRWWPIGRRANIVVDPDRSFGAPIDAESSVPTGVLSAAGANMGIRTAARAYEVREAAVKRAMEFEEALGQRLAA
jgi:hypothetical protein